jgi:transcription initiation factor TFIID TATA-box-binding protein
MVTICVLDRPLDFSHLSTNLEGVILPKKGLSWVKYRLKPENCWINFYKSGKFLITGIKSLETIDSTAQRILKILDSAGIQCNITKIEIVNIVCLGTLNIKFTLEKLVAQLNSSDVSYEPEQFPGLIYKKWGATFLLFSTGKVVITGVRDFEEAKHLLEKLEKILNPNHLN